MLDLFIDYLFVLKLISIVILSLMFVFGLDDLFIDAYFWIRKLVRRLTVYRRHAYADPDDLFKPEQKPIAIMIPAWQEVGVVGAMAEAAARQLDYENYEIFVGTYPNDLETQRDVDAVCEAHEHVHKVVCALPGPTSKADCLNNIITSIIEFEKQTQTEFQGFVLHDAEDMISPMELRLFNYLLRHNDLIQVPVYPYTKHWYELTAAHYVDEFSELHGKDVIVREAIAGQVPSAGVGTCFSRRAITKLLLEGDGLPFDTQSLTEDYDIGFRLKKWGMKEIFVRYIADYAQASLREDRRFVSDREHRVICVREYFPAKFSAAVRQKSRWIVGIVFQGFKTHRWVRDHAVNYFLWRDRRGLFANIISFIAMLIFFQLLAIYAYQKWVPDSYQFLSVFDEDLVVQTLLAINLVLFANRMLQRAIFVTQFYGLSQGLLSLPRVVWGNLVNFFAVIRAIKLVLQAKGARKVAWDKTDHHFPLVMGPRKQRIGQLLVAKGLISEAQLERALFDKPAGMRLGLYLVEQQLISATQLGVLLAQQADRKFQQVDPFALDAQLVDRLPARLALKYWVMPLAYDDASNTLTIAAEQKLSEVTLNTLSRHLQVHIELVVVAPGTVTLGIKYWYSGDHQVHPERHIDRRILTSDYRDSFVERFIALQESLGQILLNHGFIQSSTLRQATLAFYSQNSEQRFGDFLLNRQLVSEANIEQALQEQKQRLTSITQASREFADQEDLRDA